MRRHINNKVTLLTAMVLLFLYIFVPSNAYAKSSTWPKDVGYLEGYYEDGTYCVNHCDEGPFFDPIEVMGWVKDGAVNGISVSITHEAKVKNNTKGITGDSIAIAVGDSISFLPTADSGTDIFWSVSGYTNDTPYGYWSSGTGVACNASTLFGTDHRVGTGYDVYYYGYSALNITPTTPTISKSGTATLSCPSNPFDCTVTGAGSINATITWPATSGYFNYAYTKTGDVKPYVANYLPVATCEPSGRLTAGISDSCFDYLSSPLTAYKINAWNSCVAASKTDYQLNVPEQSISFSLTASAAPTVNIHFSLLERIQMFITTFLKGGARIGVYGPRVETPA